MSKSATGPKIENALCGHCLKTVTADVRHYPDALGRAMVEHYRKCARPEAQVSANSLESDLDRLASEAEAKRVAA